MRVKGLECISFKAYQTSPKIFHALFSFALTGDSLGKPKGDVSNINERGQCNQCQLGFFSMHLLDVFTQHVYLKELRPPLNFSSCFLRFS